MIVIIGSRFCFITGCACDDCAAQTAHYFNYIGAILLESMPRDLCHGNWSGFIGARVVYQDYTEDGLKEKYLNLTVLC